jgi:hypothetical protein
MHSFGGQNHLKSPFNVLTSSTEESKKGPLKLYPSGLLTRQPSHCGELNKAKFRCFFGRIHAVTGSKATLVFYICLSVLGIIFGEMAATVWALIPLIVIPLTVHSFRNRSPKFIIPLLIVTVR